MRGPERAAYRSLLRLCREADKRPEWLVALKARPTRVYSQQLRQVVRFDPPAAFPFVEDALFEACGASEEFAHPTGGAAAAARRHGRLLRDLGLSYVPDAEEFARRIGDARQVAQTALAPLDASEAQALAGNMSKTKKHEDVHHWNEPGCRTGDLHGLWSEGSDDESQAFQETEGHRWLHMTPIRFPEDQEQSVVHGDDTRPSVPAIHCESYCSAHPRLSSALDGLNRIAACDSMAPQVGDFLLTHPLACLHQPTLDRVVILLDMVDVAAEYVRGIVLGVPSCSTLRAYAASQRNRRQSAKTQEGFDLLGPLLDARLFWGGDLRERGVLESITWLHIMGEKIPGAQEIAPGIWSGGELVELAKHGFDHCGSFWNVRPILGYVGWSSKQLALELKRGVWVRVSAAGAPTAAHALCMAPPLSGLTVDRSGVSSTDTRVERRLGIPADGWAATLRAVGLDGLADFPRGGPVDRRLRDLRGSMGASFSLVGLEMMARS